MTIRITLAWALLVGTVAASQNVVVVLDDSGSMAEAMRSNRRVRKIDAAKQALRVVLENVPDDAQIGVVALNAGSGGDNWIIPLGQVDRSQLNRAISRIRATGGTPLGRYMKVGADALLEKRDEQRYGEYRLLIVTDGEASDQDLLEAYLPDIMSRGIVVDVIGVDMQSEHSLATQVHTYRQADDARSLEQAIAAALAESDPTNNDAGESDFELLAEFPEELAPVVLAALTQTRDEPIGEGLGEALSLPASGRVAPGFSPPGAGGSGRLGLTLGTICVVMMAVLMLSLIFLLKAAVRH
jgi:hypothetical protein